MSMDLTGCPADSKKSESCLKNPRLWRRAYEAAATFYLVNGSTVGLQAAILTGIRRAGDNNTPACACSVLNGLILSGGEPVIVPVELEKTWGFPLGVRPQVFRDYLGEPTKPAEPGEAGKQSEIEAALTVQPTYQGIGFDAAEIRQVFAAKGIVQIVDEAHGAHLFFQKRHPFSLQKEQADLVIQSTHKTLAALTQASMLHVNNPRWIEPVREALNILQTTSPSYLLMSSLDSVQAQMAEQGNCWWSVP